MIIRRIFSWVLVFHSRVDLNLSDEVLDEPHLGSLNQSEVEYQLAWARTYLKNYGIIVNSARSVWSITSEYASELTVSAKEIVAFTVQKNEIGRAHV